MVAGRRPEMWLAIKNSYGAGGRQWGVVYGRPTKVQVGTICNKKSLRENQGANLLFWGACWCGEQPAPGACRSSARAGGDACGVAFLKQGKKSYKEQKRPARGATWASAPLAVVFSAIRF